VILTTAAGLVKGKKVKESIAVNGTPSHSYGVSLAVWDHSVTCHPTQANTPRLHPSQTGWYSIYRPFKGGGLSKPRPRVQRATVIVVQCSALNHAINSLMAVNWRSFQV